MTWLAVALGGAVGSMARHAVNVALHTRVTTRFPIGTVVVNLIGCFAIGLLAGLLTSERIALRAHWREFVFVGLLGGFTTFSAFGLDTLLLARTHSPGQAALNVGAQVVGGLLAVWVGYQLGLRPASSP
jgi:CrcB protein